MKTKCRTVNHFIVAHRDDAALTFGGKIQKEVTNGNKCIIHLVYGNDGYMLEDFLSNLYHNNSEVNEYIEKLSDYSENKDILSKIKKLLTSPYKDNLNLGILVRTLEERCVAKSLGASLIEYDYICGYPLRGYERFNSVKSDIFSNDELVQVDLMFGRKREKELKKLYEIATHNKLVKPEFSPLLSNIISEAQKNNKVKHNLYFLSGIGGHPDHKCLAKAGMIIEKMDIPNISVFWGQDLPYSSVFEWYRCSPLNLNEFDKEIIDISNEVKSKISLLGDFYKSQLSNEDLRIVKNFAKSNYEMLHRDFFANDINKLFRNKIHKENFVEIIYKIKK